MKIFISHSWKDKSIATNLYESLKPDGHEVWYDIHQLLPGDMIQDVIDVYIKKCDVMVLIWTTQAAGSGGVAAEIDTAKRENKRIIPMLEDGVNLNSHYQLKGMLGIPLAHYDTAQLLLRRALLLLMASESDKQAKWWKECFGNVVDLGGFLNYINTYRLAQGLNEDGEKEKWVLRIEKLAAENENIRTHLLPAMQNSMEELKAIMQQLEHGQVTMQQLDEWDIWCETNKDFNPDLIGKLKQFIANDKKRLNEGGAPVHAINEDSLTKTIGRLENAVNQKKAEAQQNVYGKIKKYGGFLLGEQKMQAMVNGYLSYVILCPVMLKELQQETKVSEFVAVKEALYVLQQYLDSQDRSEELKKSNFDGFFDDAYMINNTVQILLDAKLIEAKNTSYDATAAGLVNTFVTFVMDSTLKARLDRQLQEIRTMVGLKKKEINWGQVALMVVGAAVVVGGIAALSDGGGGEETLAGTGGDTGGSGRGGYFEDKMAEFSARNGGGFNI